MKTNLYHGCFNKKQKFKYIKIKLQKSNIINIKSQLKKSSENKNFLDINFKNIDYILKY